MVEGMRSDGEGEEEKSRRLEWDVVAIWKDERRRSMIDIQRSDKVNEGLSAMRL